jgi:putative membrane protein
MKLFRAALLLSVAGLLGLAGCATRQDGSADMLSMQDRTFLENAAQGSFAEIQGSQLALEKSTNADVREFAQTMVKDHTAANQKLTALAGRKGYNPPTGPSVIQATELKGLGLLSGNTFDKAYVDRIGVAAHESTISQFEKASTGADDPDVRSFARNLLPSLRHHLQMAQALNEKQKSQ